MVFNFMINFFLVCIFVCGVYTQLKHLIKNYSDLKIENYSKLYYEN